MRLRLRRVRMLATATGLRAQRLWLAGEHGFDINCRLHEGRERVLTTLKMLRRQTRVRSIRGERRQHLLVRRRSAGGARRIFSSDIILHALVVVAVHASAATKWHHHKQGAGGRGDDI